MISFYRGAIAYILLTAAFWLMSWAMVYNRANYQWNPAWRLIVALRDGLSWIGVACVGIIFLFLVIEKFVSPTSAVDPDKNFKPRELTPRELEAIRIESERRAREHEQAKQKQIEDQKREKEQREKELAEYKKRERLRRKNRTAKDAVREALDDF